MVKNLYMVNDKTKEVTTLQFEDYYDFNNILEYKYNSKIHTVFLNKKDLRSYLNIDPHLACFSYPNCDEAPIGCCVVMGKDVEPIGHRD